jgi:predicted 3-demethylubiquinone-9 3-methyltransferase (glyoxalase superfamily)
MAQLASSKITPCLWFDGEAEEAARFYVSQLPDSRIDRIQTNLIDTPAGKAGTVLVVEFTLAGQKMFAVNGGMRVPYTYALSLHISCNDQAEIDRLWAAYSEGGKVEQCGWLQDRFGVYWQIAPAALQDMLADPDAAKAQRVMAAMLQMVKFDIAGLEAAYRGRAA